MKYLLPFLLSLALAVPAAAPAAQVKKPRAASVKAAKAKPAKPARTARRAKAAKKKPAPRKVDYQGEQVNFAEWKAVSDFADEVSLRHGFPRDELTALIRQIKYVDSAVQLVKPGPPGKPKNMNAVRALNIEPIRIRAGVRFWNDHAALLARAEREYGVPAEIIVGIIGIETVYGRDTGRFRVLDVLTTLAFAYPAAPNQASRMAFFRGELENALVLARQNGVDPLSLLGSFAGAIGMPQFMPGSVLAYGVDYDQDGAVDLRGSTADVVGSVANFLVKHGWQRTHSGALVIAANVSAGRAWSRFLDQGLEATFKLDELLAAGIAPASRPPADRLYGLVDLQNGAEATEYWLASDNFFAITKYNRSYYYAISVIELGRAVQRRRSR
ncbi:lytic murein transglycosylase B [Massilia sp. PAMC28688]|uniref:lytic murein transglycosylase B n=1 Tax=Massilia sp. PAMC28688 TaxID=2861283 RepID=UPI001C632E7C|nr:lytic murein transglycosylase B [Massilia sp. PAMC28688]QYF94054.1 lytic murein transglycosylase B [Massilia sp. PAMC28688]